MSFSKIMTFDHHYTKKQARLWAKASRSTILSMSALRASMMRQVTLQVKDLLQSLKPLSVACYVALPDEPDLNWLWQREQTEESAPTSTILLPRLSASIKEPMVFCQLAYKAGELMSANLQEHPSLKGLWEPASHVSPYTQPIDVMLIPALAMDMQGVRLGYGKGYYDRYLTDALRQGLRPKHLVGVCWQACLVEQLPKQNHDIQLDAVVTEIGCHWF